MELSDYIRILRKNWLVIVVATLLGVAIAAGYSLTRTPQYQATSTLFVSTQSGDSIQEIQQGSNFTQSRIATYLELIKEPYVLLPVIQELDLPVSAESLASRVNASAGTSTTLINITATDPDSVEAANIANAAASSLGEAIESLETRDGQTMSPLKTTRTREASAPSAAISPNVTLNLVLGGIIGLAVGLGFAVLRAVLDNKVRNGRDIEALTDRPLIGAIPFDPKAKERPLILEADPHNQRSEAFRSLRTNLQFLEMEGGHTFVITSSLPSEGKSTTTINLAVALADAGKRVALLDTDLRKPKVAEYLNIEGGAGLTDVLIGRARVADVMLPWGKRPLYVLPAGKVPPNPSELLGSKQMGQLLEALSNEFDVVLCDAPPLLPVTDAAVLSRSTTGALVVVAAGKTTTNQLEGALDALETVGSKVAGMVLTMIPTHGPDAYGYGYGYGYGGYGGYGVYGTPVDSKKVSRKDRKKRRAAEQDTTPETDPTDLLP